MCRFLYFKGDRIPFQRRSFKNGRNLIRIKTQYIEKNHFFLIPIHSMNTFPLHRIFRFSEDLQLRGNYGNYQLLILCGIYYLL